MKKHNLLLLILALLLCVAMVSGCGTDADIGSSENGESKTAAQTKTGKDIFSEDIKIAYITLSTAGVQTQMNELTFKEQLAFYPNVHVQTFDAMYDVNNQISIINDCITQGYDAILIECMDTEAVNGAIGEAEKAGVPVITVNQGASAVHSLHIQGSDYKAGWQAGEILAKEVGGKGTAVLLDVPPEQKAIGRMGTGFEEYLDKETDIELLEKPGIANWSQENANTAMRDILTKYPDPGSISVVYGVSDDVAMGAVQAIESAGRQKEGILVMGNMGYPHGLQAIKDGRLFGTGYSDIYDEITLCVMEALNLISTGTTSVTAGYTSTPTLDLVVLPTTAKNVESVIETSHWKALYEFKQ